jgi:hypothetical protein
LPEEIKFLLLLLELVVQIITLDMEKSQLKPQIFKKFQLFYLLLVMQLVKLEILFMEFPQKMQKENVI